MKLSERVKTANNGSGRRKLSQATPVSWKKWASERTLSSKLNTEDSSRSEETTVVEGSSAIQRLAGVSAPASIVELARALKHDVDLIYEWVYSNVDYQPLWGIHKGALSTLIDGVGGPLEQTVLMVELLRESSYTADFLTGSIRLTKAQIEQLLGTDDSIDPNSTENILTASQIPFTPYYDSGELVYVDLDHIWVTVDIDGTDYQFDPSYKVFSYITGIDIGEAVDFDYGDLSDATTDGASHTSGSPPYSWWKDLNIHSADPESHPGLTDMFQLYGTRLLDEIRNNHFAANMAQIIGGRTINELAGTPIRQTELPYQTPGTTPTPDDTISDLYRATFRVQFSTIDETFNTDLIYGRRLTIAFNGSDEPELRLDGDLIATGSAFEAPNALYPIQFSIVHPFPDDPDDSANQEWQQQIYGTGTYLLCTAFGTCSQAMTDFHQDILNQNIANGGADGDEDVLGETLSVYWFMRCSQGNQIDAIYDQIATTQGFWYHKAGIVGYNSIQQGPYIDIAGFTRNVVSRVGESTIEPRVIAATTLSNLALDAGILQQCLGIPGVNCMRMLDAANSAGQKLYDATNSNWGTVSTALSWPSQTKNMLEVEVTHNNSRVIIHEDDNAAVGSFAGGGWHLIDSNGNISGSVIGSLSASAAATLLTSEKEYYFEVWQKKLVSISAAPACVPEYDESTYYFKYFGYCKLSEMPTFSNAPYYPGGGCDGAGIEQEVVTFYTLHWTPVGFFWTKKPSAGYLLIFETNQENGVPSEVISVVTANDGAKRSAKKTTTGDNGRGSAFASPDPVSTFSGNYLYNRMDLSVGSGPFPYSLAFSRSYNSGDRFTDGPLGLGWSHNLAVSAKLGSNGSRGCGEVSPKEAAAAIAHSYVMLQLDLTDPTLLDFLIASLSTLWLIDQLSDNAVILNEGGQSRTFIKLVDETYNPAPGYAETLTLDGTYTLKNPQQHTWNFDADGNLETYVDPAGVTVMFNYEDGKLDSVTNGMDRTLSFSYTGDRLASVSDGNGRSVSFTVDGDGNLTDFTDAEDNTITYSYSEETPGQLTGLFLPANPGTAFVTNTYDSLGRVMSQELADAGTTTFYIAGARSEMVLPLGDTLIQYFNELGTALRSINSLGEKTRFDYDGLNRLLLTTLPELNSIERTFDENNNVLTTMWHPKPGSALADIVVEFEYEFGEGTNWNKVTKFIDGEGNETEFAYDETTGSLLLITREEIGGVAPTVEFTWTARGQVETRSVKTAPSVYIVDKFEYNTTNETLETAIRDFGGLALTTVFGYTAWGDVNSITDPRSNETTFDWDNERRLTKRIECAPFEFETNWLYDENGNLLTLQRETGEVDPEFQEWNWAYRVNNTVESATDPANKSTNFGYDSANRLISTTDAEDRVWQIAYDAVSRISVVTDPMGNHSETRTYSNNGMLASITDARNNTTEMQLDGFDRLEKRTYPDSTFEQMTYNANSQVLTFLTRKGDTITNTFDVLTRLETRDPGSLPIQTMTYDLAGRLKSISTPTVGGDPSSGTFGFDYDSAGRLITQTMPNSDEVGYELDENGNRTKLIWPDAYYAQYFFDELNRMEDIKLNGDTDPAVHFDYDALSRRTGITYINGASCTYGWELNNDLTSLAHSFTGSSVTFAYGYNAVHQVTSQSVSNAAYMWQPDASATTAYSPANNLNQYPAVAGDAFGYDDNGNLISGPYTSAAFDVLNRLTQVVSGGVTNNYWTDPFSRQVQKESDSVKTGYLNDGYQLIADFDDTPTLVNRYVPGARLDEILIQISGSDTTFLHADRLGSTIGQSDDSGTILNKCAYAPFGETAGLSGTIFGFTGQRYDAEISLYNYKARFYSPIIGRFLQPDPLGVDGDDMLLYGYVGNDPTNLIDPFGLAAYLAFEGWTYHGVPVYHSGIVITDSKGVITNDFNWGPQDGPAGDRTFVQYDQEAVGQTLGESHYQKYFKLDVPEGKTAEQFEESLKLEAAKFTQEMTDLNAQWSPTGKGDTVNCNEASATVIERSGGTVPKGPWKVLLAPKYQSNSKLKKGLQGLIRPFYNPTTGLVHPTIPSKAQ